MKFAAAVVVMAGALASAISPPEQRPLTFKDVKPILDKHCVSCHGASYPGGEIRLDSYAALMKGGKHGKAVVPKNSASSRLMKMLKGTIQPRMPMNTAPLSQQDMEKISRYINQGAKK